MKLGKYRHYKGGFYEVLGIAKEESDFGGKVVVYKSLQACPDLAEEYGEYPIFVRPHSEFTEDVEYEGKTMPRFTFAG